MAQNLEEKSKETQFHSKLPPVTRFDKFMWNCYIIALFVSLPYAAVKPFVDRYRLNSSDYVAKAIMPMQSEFDWSGNKIFAYDDNKDGTIDRIVEYGSSVGFVRIGPVSSRPYEKTYNPGDSKFTIFLNILSNGK